MKIIARNCALLKRLEPLGTIVLCIKAMKVCLYVGYLYVPCAKLCSTGKWKDKMS